MPGKGWSMEDGDFVKSSGKESSLGDFSTKSSGRESSNSDGKSSRANKDSNSNGEEANNT